jgi:hypothetical protein
MVHDSLEELARLRSIAICPLLRLLRREELPSF